MKDRGIGSGGVLGWFLQRFTGLVLTPILLIHLFTMHRYHEHGLAWQDVTALLANPYWKVLEITFLALALYHALNGLYALMQDYVKSAGLRATLFSLVLLAGIALFAFGLVTVVSIQAPQLIGAAGQPIH